MNSPAEAVCPQKRLLATLLKIKICNTSMMILNLTNNIAKYIPSKNLRAQILWFKIVRIMIMMILIFISNQTAQTVNQGYPQISMIMRIINLKVWAGLKIVSNFKILTILIIMIAIMEIVKTTIIVGNRNILRPQTSMAHSLTKIILVQIQEITRWLTHHLRMHRSALRIRLSLINSSSKISTEAMFRMWLVRLSLKRRSVHHMDSLFLTMMIAPSRGKIIRMKALKKSQLHLKALFIKETSIGSK